MHNITPKENRKVSQPIIKSEDEVISLSVKDVVDNLVNNVVKEQKVKGQAKSLVKNGINILLLSKLKQLMHMMTVKIKKGSQKHLV